MSRLDWHISRRVGSRLLATVIVFYGLVALSESLDIGRFNWLAETRGQEIAMLAVIGNAARWSIKILPVTILIGAILGLLDLQQHRELVVMKAGGMSVWRIMRGPVSLVIMAALAISVFIDGQVTVLNRGIMPAAQATGIGMRTTQDIWMEQEADAGRFVITAKRAGPDKRTLEGVTVFMPQGTDIRRIEAGAAHLGNSGEWQMTDVRLIHASRQIEEAETFSLPTRMSVGELELKLSSAEDFTFIELATALASGITDPAVRSAATTRFSKLMALPALLVGSLLIAFAFTASYRRTGSYNGMILYGIVLGFVVFVVTEMADRAGSAGVLEPAFAAWGPAIVAIVIGLTVLLHKEDGRA